MGQTRRRHLAFLGAALAAPALPRLARAQAWPSKQIRAIIPFTAGSTIDIVARIVFEPLSQQLGQSIIVENRGGAGGTIGAGMVARADPDGYTLLAHSSAHTATPAIYPNAPYDSARDFVAVAALGSSPNIAVVAPEKGIKTLQELVATAKAESRRDHLRDRGRRLVDAFLDRALPLQCRIRRRPRAVPRHARSADGSDDRARGLLPLHHRVGAALHPRREARRARSLDAETKLGLARRADHARARLCEFRLHVLERAVRAGEDAARDRRAAASGGAEGLPPRRPSGRNWRSRASIRCRSRPRRSMR